MLRVVTSVFPLNEKLNSETQNAKAASLFRSVEKTLNNIAFKELLRHQTRIYVRIRVCVCDTYIYTK